MIPAELNMAVESTKVDVTNASVVGQLLTIPACDSRPLVYHSDRQVLPTARFCRAGPLATADTCYE